MADKLNSQIDITSAIKKGERFQIGPEVTSLEIEPGPKTDFVFLAEALQNNTITDARIFASSNSPAFLGLIHLFTHIKNLTLEFGEAPIQMPKNVGDFLRHSSSIKTLNVNGVVIANEVSMFLDALAANASLTELNLTIGYAHNQFSFEKKLKEALLNHGNITKFTKLGKQGRATYTQFSIERTLYEKDPTQPSYQENFIKSGNWQALKEWLQRNCVERLIPDIYPSNIGLNTKAYIDNLAVGSIKDLLQESLKRSDTIKGQLSANNRTVIELSKQREELQRKLREVEENIGSINTTIQKQTKELGESARVLENLQKNYSNYQTALAKNEPALKKWQQTLQTDIAAWSKEDIALLLKEIGLERYCSSFTKDGIDGAVLLELETNVLISALEVSFTDAKKIMMYVYLVQTLHDIYTIPAGVLQWNNQTVCTWLEDNKFGHLVGVFKKNEITGAELVFLEKADLIGQLQIKVVDAIKLQKELAKLKETIFDEQLHQNLIQVGNNNNNNNNNAGNRKLDHLERQLEELKRFNDELKITLKEKNTKIPDVLICPITHDIMQDPVVASDGHTYERAAIEQWLTKNNTSPMSGLVLPNKQLTPSHTLKSMIRDFLDEAKKK